jgi:hypothetical protein
MSCYFWNFYWIYALKTASTWCNCAFKYLHLCLYLCLSPKAKTWQQCLAGKCHLEKASLAQQLSLDMALTKIIPYQIDMVQIWEERNCDGIKWYLCHFFKFFWHLWIYRLYEGQPNFKKDVV